MLTLRNITIQRGTNVLLQQVNWTIYAKQRIGIIGSNGTGKTTLFSLLLRELAPEGGDLDIPRQVRLAHVAQETAGSSVTATDYVLSGDAELEALNIEIKQAEDAHDGHLIATLYEKLGDIDGYTAPARAAQLLAGLGFNHQEQSKTVSEFSGGWRVRLNLAKALMSRSDVLLLDEPTNHLDLDAVLWLEQWLKKYQGTLLVISHDRDFLDQTVDHIAHLWQKQIKVYPGNYSNFERQRAADLLIQQSTYDKQQKQLAHLQSFVERFRAKATKARQAQSRLKAIERMDLVCAVQSESAFQFSFKNPEHCPNPLISIHQAKIAYGDNTILTNLSLSLTPKDRIAILGPNGAGKSSFIKLLAGDVMAAGGILEKAAGLKIGYFAQHQVDHLHLDETPLEHMRNLAKREPELALRTYLGSFGFSGDRVSEPVRHFSGGEKSRLALALIVWQKPNLLLLDEPTNHLDLEMRQALSIALQEYEGAMILVTHDRFLLRMTTDQLLLVADGKLQHFDGDLNDYQTWLIDFRKKQIAKAKSAPTIAPITIKANSTDAPKESRKPLLKEIERLDKQLEKLQREATAIEEKLTDLSLYEPQNKDTLKKLLANQTELKVNIENTEKDWLIACEKRENLA